jgi:hypothetical protein
MPSKRNIRKICLAAVSTHTSNPAFLSNLSTSPHVSSLTLLIFRIIILFISFVAFIIEYALRPIDDLLLILIYLTSLAWLAVMSFFSISIYLTHTYIKNPKHQPSKFTKLVVSNLYISQLTFQPLIVLIYYIFLYSLDEAVDIPIEITTNIIKHGMLCLFMYTDLALNNVEIRLSQWWFPVVDGAMYLGWGLLQQVIWPDHLAYPFFDLALPSSPFFILGIFTTMSLFFYVVFGLSALRDSLRRRFSRKLKVVSPEGSDESLRKDENGRTLNTLVVDTSFDVLAKDVETGYGSFESIALSR